jgi:tetratricopeptide (TPR) repeat protein
MMGFFLLASASEAAPLLAALLVGILLLVGGLLLFLLPRAEQRKPSPRLRSRAPAPTLPGYRIRREQASAPRQFLAVSRIAALAPRPAEPLPAPQEMEEVLGDDQTIPFLTAGDASIEEAITPVPPLPFSEVLAAREPEQAAPPPESAADAPAIADASPQAEPTGKALPLESPFEENQPEFPAEEASRAEEAPTVSASAPPIRKARLADVFSEPAIERPYAKEASPAAQPSEPAPEPQPPQSAARRARLVGFPAPSNQIAGEPGPDQPGASEARQEPAASSPESAAAEADTLPEARAGAGVAEQSDERIDVVIAPPVEAASLKSEAAGSLAVRIVCFGAVDLLLDGVPLSPVDSRFRASREFELLAFLAHSAALKRQSFVDRSAITEALLAEGLDEDEDEVNGDGEEYRRSPLGGWKYRLCRRLRRYGLPDHAWLETRADGALRLRADVQVDLVEFLQVSSQLRKARDLSRRSAGQPIERETVLAWLHQLQHLYRDRGEFAEQFKYQEWTQEPRRRYRNIYWHALFYAAELLASLGERQTAIQLAEELLEQEEVEAEVVFEALLTWLHEDGNKPDLLRWLNKYREWYAAAHNGRSLDKARPELISQLSAEASSTVSGGGKPLTPRASL